MWGLEPVTYTITPELAYRIEDNQESCLSYIVMSEPFWTILDHVAGKKLNVKERMLWEGWREPADSTECAVELENYLKSLL